jgi:exopolyphosphatase/guanosine-5'-triphosphate,3'-diphosphate pyrophosphatase
MIIARDVNGQVQLLDRHKETVRLRLGLTDDGDLSEDAQERALGCLTRFGQRLRGIPAENIRAVGTNTLRLAGNAKGFLERAQDALGASIEIIAGHEEARLIYLGVSHFMPPDDSQRLVVDIGGGSTEFIIGNHTHPDSMTSTEMGCVAITQTFEMAESVTAERFKLALNTCQLVLRPHAPKLKNLGWDRAIGASGSIKAISEILIGNQWANDGITLAGMEMLRQALVSVKRLDQLKLVGLSDDRKPVIAGGLAVLMAAFQLLGIEHMQVSPGALREGLILDMLGRVHHTLDVRESSIQSLLASSRIDTAQAQRVAQCAEHLFDQAQSKWKLHHPTLSLKLLLRWAALTHEVGYFISTRRYRHHTAYILENADLAGFSLQEQQLLAWMGLHHRSKLQPIDIAMLPADVADVLLHMTVLLRLSARLHRGREKNVPCITLDVVDKSLTLTFADDWLDENALTRLDLDVEAKRLEAIGFSLTLAA